MLTLIAEDDELLRALLSDFMSELGYEVKSAANGAALVELALAQPPDVIITDLHMPEMSGASMISMLEMYPGLAGVPVIIITGATQGELRDMGIPKDIPVLPKPFDFAKIVAAVERAVSR